VPQLATGIMSYLEDTIHLSDTLESLSLAYQTAQPFPHVVLDNMFSNERLNQLVDEMSALNREKWVRHEEERLVKSNLRSAVDLGETGWQFTALLHSAKFLYFISEITGIWSLLPDPYLGGGGYHVVPQGGKFDVHADRNTDHATGLTRRLAMLIYLNHGWNEAFGGQLELWNADATRCEKVVEPIFNRTLIFEVGDQNFHGVRPVTCPAGFARKSFAVYYHTVGSSSLVPHNSIYAPVFYGPSESKLRRAVKSVAPPILLRAIKGRRR
jgi:2OG-Fe(II) oxygenase superfamily